MNAYGLLALNPSPPGLVAMAGQGAMLAVLAGLGLALVRLVRGPSLADRAVALDLATTLATAFLVIHAVVAEEPAYLAVAMAVALVGFLGTVALASYLKRRGHP